MSPEPLSITLATREDVPRILEIINWAAANGTANFATEPEPLSMWLELYDQTHEWHPWLVAKEGGRIVGVAKSGPHRARGAYHWSADLSVYLDGSIHGRGVGTKLYERLLPMLRAQNYALLVAGITSGHVASERLHQKFGFKLVGTFHRIGFKFGKWHDVGYWELPLFEGAGRPPELKPVREVSG
jgi:L-amino acid N-acyltransferase YncA